MPAYRPCAREYDRISASSCASVPTLPCRPTGPAATEASAPSVTLLRSSFCTPLSFITSSTRSTCSAPAWKPQLPFASCMNTGAPHDSPLRQLITPFPYSPPTTNAAFLTSGATAAQRVRAHRSSGIVGRIACTTFAALARRSASAAEMAPATLDTAATTAIAAKANLFMGHLW